MDDQTTASFRQEYPALLAEVISTAVTDADLTIDDIALILPHNVNRLSWLTELIRLPAGLPYEQETQARLYLPQHPWSTTGG